MAEEEKKPEQKKPAEEKKEIKYLVRVASTDLDGNKGILYAMRNIKGINTMFANAICVASGVPPETKAGRLTDAQVQKLNDTIKEPGKYGIPVWLLNRRKDNETGNDIHVILGDLQFVKENDIKKMKKIKCYKGMRHAAGLPVRGQKMRSKHRRSKSRGKGGIGVKKRAGAKAGRS